jgi:hypothetical protein
MKSGYHNDYNEKFRQHDFYYVTGAVLNHSYYVKKQEYV